MSYTSENYCSKQVRLKDLIEFVELLGYERVPLWGFEGENAIARFYYFNEMDYLSWTGINLAIYETNSELIVSTRTTAARSFHDLEDQNYTIQSIKKFFGGTFATDEGKGRYLRTPPTPAQSGCHLAFQRFGHNLIRAILYLEHRDFPQEQWKKTGSLEVIDEMNPRLLSNNLMIPFLVSVMEDFSDLLS